MKSKKAAMEMSMGTIVTIVLLMTVLIMGMLFTRNIMCSGIQLTDDITAGMANEIKGLFDVGETGIECVGESTEEVIIPIDGKLKKLGCIAISDVSKTYDFVVGEPEVFVEEGTSRITPDMVKRWTSVYGKTGYTVRANDDDAINIISIKVPEGNDAFDAIFPIDVIDENGNPLESHEIYVSFSSLGAVSSAIC